jgi:hypothetical protein
VVWYYDPALTDEILWPHAARTYLPRWPTNEAEGLEPHRHRQPAWQRKFERAGQDQLVAPGQTNLVPNGLGG